MKKRKQHTKAKAKSNVGVKPSQWPPKTGGTQLGLHPTRVRNSRDGDFPKQSKTFTPEQTAQPDPTEVPDINNPLGAQSGLGPTNQEGEGERQNAELAELDKTEPELELDEPDDDDRRA